MGKCAQPKGECIEYPSGEFTPYGNLPSNHGLLA